MEYSKLRQDKGVAGMNILLAVVATLFMAGLIVMVFVIAGSRLQTSVVTSDTASAQQDDLNVTGAGVTLTTCASSVDGTSASVTLAINATGGETIPSTNYSSSGCVLNSTGGEYDQELWNVTYNYRYTTNPEALTAINDTTLAISDVTDWFDIFIVLTALIVLVLLVVVIINSIRGSGLMGSGKTA